jgi:hypothetical protein
VGQLREHAAGDVLGAVQHVQFAELQAVLGERPGLVRTDHVHPGQTLDRGQFLHQHVLLPQPDHADGEGERGQQHEPLGHHRHQRAGCRENAVLPGARLVPLHPDRGQAHRDQQPGDQPQDLVDARLQFGLHQRELARLHGQPRRVGVVPDPGRSEGAHPGDDEAARHHLVPGLLQQRVGLAGEQGFVHFEVGRLDHLAVDDDLVSGTDLDQVVEHDLLAGDLDADPVPADGGFALPDHGQAVERLLRPQLLHHADAGVDDDQEAEQRVHDRAGAQHHHEQHHQQEVDPGEDVGLDDVPGAPARARR